MRHIFLVASLLLVPFAVRAQDCDKVVVDEAQVLGARAADVQAAADALQNQGADVRVRTVAHTVNLDMDENVLVHSCGSWRSPNGQIKSTLIVLMVAPYDRKMGIYYGGAWHHALDDHWVRIKQDYMALILGVRNGPPGLLQLRTN